MSEEQHPPHKYCPKGDGWRDLDGTQCGLCGTTLVLKRLNERTEPAFQVFGNDPGPELIFLPTDGQVYPRVWPFASEQDLRRFIRQEVCAELDALANELRMNTAFQPKSRTTAPTERRIE